MHLNSGLKPICKIWTMDDADIDVFCLCLFYCYLFPVLWQGNKDIFLEVTQPCYQHKLVHKNV